MATIAKDRLIAYGGAKMGQGPPKLMFPVAASQTGKVGRLVTISSGLVSFTEGSSGIVGILEQAYTSSKSTNTPVGPITLGLPNRLYEGTFTGAAAVADIGDSFQFGLDSTINVTVVTGGTTGHGAVPLGFVGYQWGRFETHGYIGRNDTSETSGSANYPLAQAKGTIGDTNARVVFVFHSEGLAFHETA